MNIAMLLTPKSTIKYLDLNSTLRQGLEKFRVHGFTAVPVLDEEGMYRGTVSEGDFLRYIINDGEMSIKKAEDVLIRDIMKQDSSPAMSIDEDLDIVGERLMDANFIPIVDTRGCFIGIVTRKSFMKYLRERLVSKVY